MSPRAPFNELPHKKRRDPIRKVIAAHPELGPTLGKAITELDKPSVTRGTPDDVEKRLHAAPVDKAIEELEKNPSEENAKRVLAAIEAITSPT